MWLPPGLQVLCNPLISEGAYWRGVYSLAQCFQARPMDCKSVKTGSIPVPASTFPGSAV